MSITLKMKIPSPLWGGLGWGSLQSYNFRDPELAAMNFPRPITNLTNDRVSPVIALPIHCFPGQCAALIRGLYHSRIGKDPGSAKGRPGKQNLWLKAIFWILWRLLIRPIFASRIPLPFVMAAKVATHDNYRLGRGEK